MAAGGLKHLEALHQKSGGLEPLHSRRLKLDTGRTSATTKPEKLDRDKPEHSKAENLDDEGDNLPHPHEIFHLPILKTCRKEDSNNLTSDSDISMVSGLNTMHESLKSNLGNLPTKQSPIIESMSTTPLKSNRRSRTALNGSLSPSPVTKRQRLSTYRPSPDVTQPLVVPPQTAKHDLTVPRRPSLHAANITKDAAQGVKLPLFLEDVLSSEPPSQPNRAVYEADEPFTLDVDAFDIESSPMLSTSFPPNLTAEGTRHIELPNNTLEVQSTFCMDEDLPLLQDNAETGGEDESITELDDYDQGIAELNAWLYSGAVEVTD